MYFKEEQLDYILKLQKHLKRFFKKSRGAVVLYKDGGKILFAIDDETRFIRLYKYIYNYIIYIIYDYYKKQILKKLTSNLFGNEIFEIIIKETLFCFDEEYDKNFIKNNLVLNDSLNLEGFFNFKLSYLKQKWEHLVELITSNGRYLQNYEVNLDLVRYLISELTCNVEDICLFCEGKKYFLKTANNETVIFKKINYSKKQSFKELVKSIVILSPKKIKICSEIKNKDFVMFRDIFIDKLK